MTEWIDKAAGAYCRLLEVLLVALTVAMVILRYGFNSGITVSEELSRRAFGRLGPTGKKVCLALAESLMIFCAWLMPRGACGGAPLGGAASSPAKPDTRRLRA
jgi:TRAP-type C4-dicarboxylate transport system permease small subunit